MHRARHARAGPGGLRGSFFRGGEVAFDEDGKGVSRGGSRGNNLGSDPPPRPPHPAPDGPRRPRALTATSSASASAASSSFVFVLFR